MTDEFTDYEKELFKKVADLEFDKDEFVLGTMKTALNKYPDLMTQDLSDTGTCKKWEVLIQDCIEKWFPDNAWWEVYSGDIFNELLNGQTPGRLIHHIADDLAEVSNNGLNKNVEEATKSVEPTNEGHEITGIEGVER